MKFFCVLFISNFVATFGVEKKNLQKLFLKLFYNQILFFFQFLRLSSIKSEVIFDPKYGNATIPSQNLTHVGEITIWFFQNIPKFIMKSLTIAENGKILANTTLKPCEQRNQKRFDLLMSQVLDMPKNGTNANRPPQAIQCPCKIVGSFFVLILY